MGWGESGGGWRGEDERGVVVKIPKSTGVSSKYLLRLSGGIGIVRAVILIGLCSHCWLKYYEEFWSLVHYV